VSLGNSLIDRWIAEGVSGDQSYCSTTSCNLHLTSLSLCRDWPELLEGCLPKQVAVTRTNRDWEPDVLNRYRAMVGSPLQSTVTFEVTRGIQRKGPAHKASVNVLYATME
jgi:hypothetical protein